MPSKNRVVQTGIVTLAGTLSHLPALSHLSQTQVAARIRTTQTAIAQLESGRQSPSMATLRRLAKANGFCLDVRFIRFGEVPGRTGCVLSIENHRSARHDIKADIWRREPAAAYQRQEQRDEQPRPANHALAAPGRPQREQRGGLITV